MSLENLFLVKSAIGGAGTRFLWAQQSWRARSFLADQANCRSSPRYRCQASYLASQGIN